jgi:hypothetical protein
MCPSPTRLELWIDVFDKTVQKALALADLKPPELVAAILQEFREVEYLGDDPAQYRLLKAADRTPLDDESKLSGQLQGGERLVLVENEVPPPEGTRTPSQPIYLREQGSGRSHRIAWQPAIIGRVSENMSDNEWVAVDLKSSPTGLRVSRRHVRLSEDDGKYFIEALSSNPVQLVPVAFVQENREGSLAVTEGKQRLYPGDIIKLERSDISLKFIVRENQAGGSPVETGQVTAAPGSASVPPAAAASERGS